MSKIIRIEPVQKLAQSHARLLTIATELLEDTGGCDHDVGVCHCQLIREIESATEIQTEVQNLLPKLG